MKLTVARAMMVMAVRCLGDHRREWAMAMQAEFDVAVEEGEPLAFALGCLTSTWREMPVREEGRFALASHLLVIGVIVPMATLLISSVAGGAPFLSPDDADAGLFLGSGRPGILVNDGNRVGLPLLAALTLILGLGHLHLAWAMLDRDWVRVAATGRAGAAVMVTMVIFTGILFMSALCALPQMVMLTIEMVAIWALARWHADLTAPAQARPRPHPD